VVEVALQRKKPSGTISIPSPLVEVGEEEGDMGLLILVGAAVVGGFVQLVSGENP